MDPYMDLSLTKAENTEPFVTLQSNGKAPAKEICNEKPLCGFCLSIIDGRHKDRQFCTNSCRVAAWRRNKTIERLGIANHPILHHGKFQDYAKRYRRIIDVIITDPPYGRDFLSLYKDLAHFALDTLHPGGWLLCLTGWGLLWDIGNIFNKTRLEYVTVCTYLMPSISPLKAEKRLSTGLRKFQQKAKPLLWYQKPGSQLHRRRAGTTDLVRAHFNTCELCGSGETLEGANVLDRQAFHWQQCLEGFKQIAWVFANPQDVICDPCMGSGTTLVAAYLQNRKHVIGIEKDAAPYTYATERMKETEAGYRDMPLEEHKS